MNTHPYPVLLISTLLLAALACELPGVVSQESSPSELQTLQAVGTQAAQSTMDAAGQSAAGETPAATEEPQATEAPPEPTATETVVHTTFPSSPGSVQSFMTDRSSRALASEGRAIGDNFDRLLFERPFSSGAMVYSGWLDITRGEMNGSPPWFYVTIFLEEGAPDDATPLYGVEVDIDLDGRGDWLIWGQVPPGTEWTTDNVKVWRDSNNDVGGSEPVQSDPPQSGNGYDELVFNSGHGPDPDAAWIRRSPGTPSHIEIAFKQTLIGPPGQFLWGVWADEGAQDPSWFDYNDQFSISQAGSPVSTTSHYPLKELALVDNSCRWGYGFEPTGAEPGACFVPPTPTPTSEPEPDPTSTPFILLTPFPLPTIPIPF